MSDLVALSFDLMTSHDEVQFVLVEESFRHIWPKLTAHSSLTDGTAILYERKKTIKQLIFNVKHPHSWMLLKNKPKNDIWLMGVHLRLWIGPEQVTHGTWRKGRGRC